MVANNSSICIHQDCRFSTMAELAATDAFCPPATDSWRPIPHSLVHDRLVEAVEARGLTIISDRVALSDASKPRAGRQYATDAEAYTGDGARMFGLITIESDIPGVGFGIGYRSSYDKTLALAIACGLNVFICDNMMLNGDQIQLRKHTSMIDIVAETRKALNKAVRQFVPLTQFVTDLRGMPVSNASADTIIIDAMEAGILPGTSALDVARAWRHGKSPAKVTANDNGFADRLADGVYSDRNAWALHGIFTDTAFKRTNLTSAGNGTLDRHSSLNTIFQNRLGIATPMAASVN